MKIKKNLTAMLTVFTMIFAAVPAMAAIEDTGFSDVSADAWYAEAVKYNRDNGLMSGMSQTTFEPDTALSRAMLASILYRQAESPIVAEPSGFTDVPNDEWYSRAVAWAAGNDMVSGVGNNSFSPEAPVTIEQTALILQRAAGNSLKNTASEPLAGEASTASPSTAAVKWAVENGIIREREGQQVVADAALTRGEAAAAFQAYFSQISPATETPITETPATIPATENPTSNSTTANSTTTDTTASEKTAITITVGETVIPATLNNSVSAQALIESLPLTVSMTNGAADYYANLTAPLTFDETDVHNGWQNGDIGFDTSGNYLTIFHSGEDTSEGNGNQVTLGQVSELALLSGLGASISATFALADTETNTEPSENNTLVVYYSHSQRTEGVAELLSEKVGGDIYEIEAAEPYTGADSAITDRVAIEVESGTLPELAGELPDLSEYDTILIGGPVWSDTLAAPLLSYLDETDFTGKTVAPFSTDQGTYRNYEADFIAAAQSAERIAEYLRITNTPSISATDMDEMLDTWIAAVNQ